jgi:glycosyltransferase involved in cell wall biosynthesis
MKISIALCTYNGAAYLDQQLGSILAQTRTPDELVVCDDLSTDNTTAIVKNLAVKASFPVRLYSSRQNIGSTKNFEKAIRLCSGDIIVLSDQDDVWHPEKLQRIETVLLNSSRIGAVITDAEMVDEHLNRLGYSLWQSLKFSRFQQRRVSKGKAFEVLLKHNFATGTTMAFRAEFNNFILPIPANWVHDGWIGLLIAAMADFAIIPELLNRYRQHGNQQIGAVKKGFLKQLLDAEQRDSSFYLTVFEQYKSAYDRLLAISKRINLKKDIRKVAAKMNHMYSRAHIPEGKLRHFLVVLNEVMRLRYHRYSNGWKSILRDLFYGSRN